MQNGTTESARISRISLVFRHIHLCHHSSDNEFAYFVAYHNAYQHLFCL